MARFDLYLSGRQGVQVEVASLSAARAELRAVVAEELAAARRKSKQATKHKHSDDNYEITLGPDRRSALWTRITLITTL